MKARWIKPTLAETLIMKLKSTHTGNTYWTPNIRTTSCADMTNNLSVIAMLQQQQTLLQRVLSSQGSITQRQQEMDKEINIIKEKLEAGADAAVSTSSSSCSSTKKRKRTVSRTLSVNINIFITRIASIYSRERSIVFMNL